MLESLNFFELALPFLCIGAFLSILLSIMVILRYFPERIHYSLLIMTLISLTYGIGIVGSLGNSLFGKADNLFFYRLHERTIILFLFFLPLFLSWFLDKQKLVARINFWLLRFGAFLTLLLLSLSIINPELLTRGELKFELQMIYGPVLLLYLIYASMALTLNPGPQYSITDRIIYPLAFVQMFYFGLSDFLNSLFRVSLSFFPALNYPQTLLGIVIALSLLYFGIIKGFVRKARMEEAANIRAIKSQQELIYSSSHDQLTGLKNRNSFYLHLSKSIHQSLMSDSNDSMALLVIDVDNLNSINNSFGHAVGDQVLRIVAERVQHFLRVTDQVFRIGGDEFAAVLHKLSDPSLAGMAADKLIRAFSEPVELDTLVGEKNIYVGISMGIACYPQDSDDPKELINHADMALFEAKKMKNSFRYYSQNMEFMAEQRVTLTGIIRKALRQNLFELHYQPLNDVNGNVKGAEALIRLDYEGKEIPPSLLIPVAESSGLILRLGEWVIEEAIRNRQQMEEHLPPDFFISINLSVKQLKDVNLIPFITHCLQQYEQNCKSFRFEITESSLMENFEIYKPVLEEMKKMGLRIVLDDFGTGYSSLGYLKHLPVDTVKIDRTFLVNFPNDKQNGAIIDSIFNLANGLMMDVVVEGVENKEQRSHLTSYQYSHLQGFYFSKPLPLNRFLSYLGNQV